MVLLLVVRRLAVADLAIRPVAVARVTRPVAAATHPAAVGPVTRPAQVAPAIHQEGVAVIRPATERLRGRLATDHPVIRPVAACLARPHPRKNRMR